MSSPKAKHILERQIALRETLWPGVENRHLWNRKERDGFATMPRLMPLIMNSMDHLSGKGFPVSQVYLDLWCRTLDEGFLQLNRPEEMAFHSGFSGQRAVRTWKDRMKRLAALEFIGTVPGPLGEMSFAILYNPFHVLKRAHIAKKLPENYWRSLIIRANEVGATDFEDLDETGKLLPPPPPPPAPPAATPQNAFAALLNSTSTETKEP
ncbi:hypothetical protein [Novosphingobium gossypii]|uniref:hypothetical protein n=1 Tax=Novosphingobium gossypii TaxID=1604774 RepID=UPI003D1BB25E